MPSDLVWRQLRKSNGPANSYLNYSLFKLFRIGVQCIGLKMIAEALRNKKKRVNFIGSTFRLYLHFF